MRAWGKVNIVTDDGETREAQAPIIISASRSTDIPAFYADWLIERIRRGYVAWKNPFNGKTIYVSFAEARMIVFWSKNPRPLLAHLDCLKEMGIHCYIQYTLNDYVDEGLEPGVPSVLSRIETFRLLIDRLGPGAVVWRFDPLILSDTLTIDRLLEKVARIGDQLKGYTEKLVYSYADIGAYRKVKAKLSKHESGMREFSKDEKHRWAKELANLNEQWGFQLATCAEDIDLDQYGISHNKCVDDELMVRLFHDDPELMEFIGAEKTVFGEWEIRKSRKDAGQRKACGCIMSKDIGEYNTCPHLCEYCYANSDNSIVLRNWELHKKKPFTERITPNGCDFDSLKRHKPEG